MDFTQKQSVSIDLLRFPLCILVVLCHTKILFGIPGAGIPQGAFQQGLQIFLCEVIPHIAVPTFVFFSGYLFFGMFAVVQFAASLAGKVNRHSLTFWGGCSFFVYAVHVLYSPDLMKSLGLRWKPESDLGFAAFFMVFASFTLLIGVSLFWVTQKWIPKICSILIGGRLR